MSLDRLTGAKLTRRRFTTLSAAGVAGLAAVGLPLAGGMESVSAQSDIVATMITDTAGIGDQNFNDLANKGGTEAAAEFGLEWRVIESPDASAYIPNLTAGAEQGELTIGVGALLKDAVDEVSSQFPDKKFLLIDQTSDMPNVKSTVFAEQEPAFLVGVIAGKVTKTGKIGLIGGIRVPPVMRYEVGFVAGIRSVNPTAADSISIVYADSFTDAAKGKELALAQFEQGVDITLPVAGGTGSGAYQAAAEKGEGFWVIGGDTSQDHLAPGRELCVAQKGVDLAVYQTCKDLAEGTFASGVVLYDLKSGGVSLRTLPGRVPDEIVNLAMAYQEMIIDGSLVVPVDDDTLAAFVPPAEPTPSASPVSSPTA